MSQFVDADVVLFSIDFSNPFSRTLHVTCQADVFEGRQSKGKQVPKVQNGVKRTEQTCAWP